MFLYNIFCSYSFISSTSPRFSPHTYPCIFMLFLKQQQKKEKQQKSKIKIGQIKYKYIKSIRQNTKTKQKMCNTDLYPLWTKFA